jgi:hypothetical protein
MGLHACMHPDEIVSSLPLISPAFHLSSLLFFTDLAITNFTPVNTPSVISPIFSPTSHHLLSRNKVATSQLSSC